MVEKKKMSKSSIAIIVLSVLLVLSMVMGLTGAWFTDKATGGNQGANNTFQFGQISAPLTISSTAMSVTLAGEKAVPGDSVGLPAINVGYTANFKTYLFLTFNDIVVKQNGTALTNAQIAVLFEEATASGIAMNLANGFEALSGQTNVYYKVYDPGTVAVSCNSQTLTIDTDLTRATKLQSGDGAPVLENSTIVIEYSIAAAVVQYDHVADAAAAYGYIPA
jgi:flagellar basal body-associated protein FliL